LGEVGALVQAWYPGQECGNAIADVLFGDVSPSGRLPQSWPVRVEQNPAWTTYPGDHGVVRYGEGIFAGYRSYVSTGVQPLFPFGFGLGYTTFEYGVATPSSATVAAGDKFSVSLDIRNSGDRAGTEIVQVYVRDPVASINRPKRELRGFARVHLDPGASERVTIELDMRSLAWFDADGQRWIAEAGEFEIQVGASSEDIRSCCRIRLTDTWHESARDAWMSIHR
jgi:beta-glucosidase